jgi:hypothetical protein
MLRAVTDVVKTDPDITEYLKAITNKAGQFISTRNQIVHGDVVFTGYSKISRYHTRETDLAGRYPRQ